MPTLIYWCTLYWLYIALQSEMEPEGWDTVAEILVLGFGALSAWFAGLCRGVSALAKDASTFEILDIKDDTTVFTCP